jgi:S-adenosylmethionine/arginine decarboxylase-like enzyme
MKLGLPSRAVTETERHGTDRQSAKPFARRSAKPCAFGSIVEEAVRQSAWGIASSFDIYECNPDTIRDADAIKRFVVELCERIEMRRFGETLVVHFGEDERVAGYSMVQLIETSLISAHFANATSTVYLDVFSCKPYDPNAVDAFAREFFGGSHSIVHVNMRL